MGKTYRQPYRGARAFDVSCRCHGGCQWCLDNRMKSRKQLEESSDSQIEEWVDEYDEGESEAGPELLSMQCLWRVDGRLRLSMGDLPSLLFTENLNDSK